MDLPMKSHNVIFSQNPRLRPCRAIPLEQLTIGKCGMKSSKGMELRLGDALTTAPVGPFFDGKPGRLVPTNLPSIDNSIISFLKMSL